MKHLASAKDMRDAGYIISDEDFETMINQGYVFYLECLYDEWPWYKKLLWKLGWWKP